MSSHFNANQYDDAFHSKRLQNWQIPTTFKEHPSQYEGFTQIIANDRGHILPGVARSNVSPWGEFLGTWDMPRKIPGNVSKSMEQSNDAVVKEIQKNKRDNNGLKAATSPDKLHDSLEKHTPNGHRPENPSPNKAGSPPPKMTTPGNENKCVKSLKKWDVNFQ